MSEDLTKKLPTSDSDKLTLIVSEVQRLNVKTDAMQERLDRVEGRLQALDDKVKGIDDKVGALDDKLKGIDDKVGALDRKVEERLYDTRPIWEKLVTDVAQLQEGQQRLENSQQHCEERFDVLQKDSREIKTFLRDILRRMSIFFEALVTMQADYRDIYDRVRSLETKNG